jgi:hypothetical protein
MVGETVTERIIISYNSYPWGIWCLEASGDEGKMRSILVG